MNKGECFLTKSCHKTFEISTSTRFLLKEYIAKLKKLTDYKILTVFSQLHKLFQFTNFIMNIVSQPEYSFCKMLCLCLYVIYKSLSFSLDLLNH